MTKGLAGLLSFGLILAGTAWWIRNAQLRSWIVAAGRIEGRMAEIEHILVRDTNRFESVSEHLEKLQREFHFQSQAPAGEEALRQELDTMKQLLESTREELERRHGIIESFDQAREAEVDLVVFRIASEELSQLSADEAANSETYFQLEKEGRARLFSWETVRTLVWPRETLLGDGFFSGESGHYSPFNRTSGFSALHTEIFPTSLEINRSETGKSENSPDGLLVPAGLNARSRGRSSEFDLFSKDEALFLKFGRSDSAGGSGLHTVVPIDLDAAFQRLGTVAVSKEASGGADESEVVFLGVRVE